MKRVVLGAGVVAMLVGLGALLEAGRFRRRVGDGGGSSLG